ncbi:MAG: ATP-dependent helicase RecQ [Myxococcaceae bacterium]|nr:ATP-dependent helicase RecQ [Myxococcaceae bacterium]
MHSDVLTHLERVFGLSALRPQQTQAIAAFLASEDVLVVLPTGFGKSLCFQLPAVTLSRRGEGCTLVVSPLIALMNDQVSALVARGVRAHALHSGVPWAEQSAVLDDLAAQDLVYVSPERLESARVRRAVRSVARVVIDEAHCISEWGHDFRPEYQKLGWLKHELGAPIMALTATATARVREHIVSSLSLREPVRVDGPSVRPNLSFRVALAPEKGDTRTDWASELLSARGFAQRKVEGRAIVYTATRKRAEAVHKALRKAGVRAGYYHAGRSDSARVRAQQQFEAGTTPVLVATSAFGMGIDMPDVRMVLHVEAPGTLESYVQQAGRAGRDGRPAECWLAFSPGDARIHERLRGARPTPGSVEGFRALEHYAFSGDCRQLLIAKHLESPAAGACGGCDACCDPAAVVAQRERVGAMREQTARVREKKRDEELAVSLSGDQLDTIFAFVDALPKPLGRRHVAHGLRGSRARALARKGLSKNPHFGALKSIPESAIYRGLDALLQQGLLVPKGQKYPTLWIAGKPVRPARDVAAGRATKGRAPRGSPLENTLRNFRRSEAKKRRIKPYQVFQNRTLKALCEQRPESLHALREVWGIGEERVEKYGPRLLELCASVGA